MTQEAYTGHSGPYIVTTLVPLSPPEAGHDVSRHAVATLGEARETAAQAVLDRDGYQWIWTAWRESHDAAFTVPETGATVSLPDGTVIEVEPVTKATLRNLVREAEVVAGRPRCDTLRAGRTELIAAFNAAQAEGLMT